MGIAMQGRRLPNIELEDWYGSETEETFKPGDYARFRNLLVFRTPNGILGTCSTKIHAVTDEQDGSITVSPSILILPNEWHGYLDHGVWRSC